MGETRSGPVLLVEDSLDDVLLTRRAFRKAGIESRLEVCADGEQGIHYLQGHGHYADRERHPFPGLVLLDWKLPRRSGAEVLQWIRARGDMVTLPVVVLSSSRQQEDIDAAYRLGANSYLEKPVAFEQLQTVVERLHLYWLRTNVTAARPPRNGGDS